MAKAADMEDAALVRLRRIDSCAVSDALDSVQVVGVAPGLARMWPVRSVVAGRVRTVQAGPRSSAAAAGHIAAPAVDTSGPDDVLVVANEGRTDVSCWGGLLSRAAARNGIQGVIVDGACRDVVEAQEAGFPVFARAVTPTSARGRIVQLTMDVPVTIGAVRVAPGDFVIADQGGVVFVPAALIGQVLDTAERITGRERAMAQEIAAGRPVSDVMHDSRFDAAADG